MRAMNGASASKDARAAEDALAKIATQLEASRANLEQLAGGAPELQAEARRLAVAASTLAGATAALGRLAANAADARALLETEDEFFDGGAGDASELREGLPRASTVLAINGV